MGVADVLQGSLVWAGISLDGEFGTISPNAPPTRIHCSDVLGASMAGKDSGVWRSVASSTRSTLESGVGCSAKSGWSTGCDVVGRCKLVGGMNGD